MGNYMKTVWILLFAVQGCVATHVETRAYNTEIECRQALKEKQSNYSPIFDDVKADCQSTDSLLLETATK